LACLLCEEHGAYRAEKRIKTDRRKKKETDINPQDNVGLVQIFAWKKSVAAAETD
jgi:hypothetical protein